MKHIETAVLARLEVAFAPAKKADKPKPKYGSDKWWKSLSKNEQKQYLKEHPKSKYNPANKLKKSKNKLVKKKKPLIPGVVPGKGKPHTEHQIRMDEKRKMRQAQLRKDKERKKKEAKKKDELRKKAEKRAQDEKKAKKKEKQPKLTEAQKKAKQEEERLAEQYKNTKKPEDFEALEEHKTASRTAKFIDWYEETVNKAVDKIKRGTLERIGNVIGADLEDMLVAKDSHRPPSVRLYEALNKAIERNEAELDQINEKIAKAKDQLKIAKGKKDKAKNPDSIDGWNQKIVSTKELLGRLGVQRKILMKKVEEGHKQRDPLKARADRYHIKEGEEREKVRDLRSLGIKTGRAKKGGKTKPTKPKLHKLKRAKR